MTNKNQSAILRFREQFINAHNRGEERFLRGLFIEEFEDFLSKELALAEERGEQRGRTSAFQEVARGLAIATNDHPELKTAIYKILYEAQLEQNK